MSTVQTPAATTVDPTMAAGTAQFLSPVVIGLEALVVNGKQAHWHVRGANFRCARAARHGRRPRAGLGRPGR